MGGQIPRAPAGEPRRHRLTGHRSSLDGYEVAILVALALLSLWVLAWLLGRSIANGQVWTGVDCLHASDPFQYLAWIRDASHSILISNLFEIRPSAASFLHPGFLVSGLITRAGVAPWLAYLLWKPLAVVALFLGVRAYVRHLIPNPFGRRIALILGLFFVSTAAYATSLVTVGASAHLYLLGVEVELWPGTWLWGYSFTVLAVAAIPITLLLYERDRRRDRIGLGAAGVALLCSWLQPWQGATLLGIVFISELLSAEQGAEEIPDAQPRAAPKATWRWPSRRRLTRLAVTLGAGAAPLLYYALLERLDPSWTLNGQANRFGGWPVWTLFLSFAPLALPAALAYTKRPRTFGELALRVWPLTVLGIYWVIALTHIGTFPIHTFQGLTIPLGILAVIGVQSHVRRSGRVARAIAVGVVAVLMVPALVWKLNDAQSSTTSNGVVFPGAPPNPFYLAQGEANALTYLSRDALSGGVLATAYLGEVTPARTGRQTWIGLPSWSPHYTKRYAAAERLFSGTMAPQSAIAFVRSTGARFILSDCGHRANLQRLIGPIVVQARRFGCATVLQVRRS